MLKCPLGNTLRVTHELMCCAKACAPASPKTAVYATVAQAEAGRRRSSRAGTAELELDTLLAADPELDPPDLPSVADLLAV